MTKLPGFRKFAFAAIAVSVLGLGSSAMVAAKDGDGTSFQFRSEKEQSLGATTHDDTTPKPGQKAEGKDSSDYGKWLQEEIKRKLAEGGTSSDTETDSAAKTSTTEEKTAKKVSDYIRDIAAGNDKREQYIGEKIRDILDAIETLPALPCGKEGETKNLNRDVSTAFLKLFMKEAGRLEKGAAEAMKVSGETGFNQYITTEIFALQNTALEEVIQEKCPTIIENDKVADSSSDSSSSDSSSSSESSGQTISMQDLLSMLNGGNSQHANNKVNGPQSVAGDTHSHGGGGNAAQQSYPTPKNTDTSSFPPNAMRLIVQRAARSGVGTCGAGKGKRFGSVPAAGANCTFWDGSAVRPDCMKDLHNVFGYDWWNNAAYTDMDPALYFAIWRSCNKSGSSSCKEGGKEMYLVSGFRSEKGNGHMYNYSLCRSERKGSRHRFADGADVIFAGVSAAQAFCGCDTTNPGGGCGWYGEHIKAGKKKHLHVDARGSAARWPKTGRPGCG